MTLCRTNDIIHLVQNIELERRGIVTFNYDKLSGRIVEMFGTRCKFAAEMDCSERTLSLKMNGKRPWTQSDIFKAVKLLKLKESDIPIYFFNEKVQKIERSDGDEYGTSNNKAKSTY